jgi:hypothetical protein
MTSLWVEDLSRSDDLDREQLRAVRGGILVKELPPAEGPSGFCGTGVPSYPGVPSWPLPGLPGVWPRNCWEPSVPSGPGPAGPCGPALDPRAQ